MKPRTVFLGTPEFAVPSLEAVRRLSDAGTLDLVAVVTQPDRAGHRGRVTAPPVKERALALRVPVLQPARLDGAAVDEIRGLEPQLLVWAAYGNRIPRGLIDAVSGRAVNVHASLLPRWRGAAPIAHAILAGDRETGVTLMEGTAGLDEGPILAQERTTILETVDTGSLTERLADLGATVLERDLPRYLAGDLHARPQDGSKATIAPKLTTSQGEIDFSRPADDLSRQIRAFTPDPGAWTTFRGRRLLIRRAWVKGGAPKEHGVIEIRERFPHVAAGAGWLEIREVVPQGRQWMTGRDWANGIRELDGARLPS